MMQQPLTLQCEHDTERFAAKLAAQITAPCWIALRGELGAGKTTFTRYLLRALGYQGTVKSPTYTLVEPYELDCFTLYHFDLYRLSDPEELEYLGFRDYVQARTVALVEWPSKGRGWLPEFDLSLEIDIIGESRQIRLYPGSEQGVALLRAGSEY